MDLFAALTDDKRFFDLIELVEGESNIMTASALEMIENRGYERGLIEGAKHTESALDFIEKKGYERGISFGIEKGRAEGREQGKVEGENRLSRLISALIADGKTTDIESVAVNPLRRNELYKFYNI